MDKRVGENMALNSPSHRFGQIIGDILEETIIDYLRPVADHYSLYLDFCHPRSARNGRKDVRWDDINGNTHKLDIVMEKNGDESRQGEPRVFIEIAWCRYTKHSKNKAQEISGAIRPLIDKYNKFSPFFGAIVAGEFTQNSINQMKSEGFEVVYIPINVIVSAFNVAGIDAYWEENTPEHVIQEKVDAFAKLDKCETRRIMEKLVQLTHESFSRFMKKLCDSLERTIVSVRIVSIFGEENTFSNVPEACDFIVKYNEGSGKLDFLGFELYIRYSNGDKHDAKYADRSKAIAFLRSIS